MAQTQSISSEWLYDRLLVPSGSANSVFTGFAVGNGGQAPNGAAGVAKTYADCNLPSSAGRLNKPDSFVVQGLNCFPEIGTVYADQLLIYQQCWVELKNSNNVVVAWRLSHDMIPAGTGFKIHHNIELEKDLSDVLPDPEGGKKEKAAEEASASKENS